MVLLKYNLLTAGVYNGVYICLALLKMLKDLCHFIIHRFSFLETDRQYGVIVVIILILLLLITISCLVYQYKTGKSLFR